MIELVSRPEARPPKLMPDEAIQLVERCSGSRLERLRRRDRADDVAVEVAYLHDHATATGSLEMQLTTLLVQGVGHLRRREHLLQQVRRRGCRERVDGHRGGGLRRRSSLNAARALRLARPLDSAERRKVEVHRSSWITVLIHPWIDKRRSVVSSA